MTVRSLARRPGDRPRFANGRVAVREAAAAVHATAVVMFAQFRRRQPGGRRRVRFGSGDTMQLRRMFAAAAGSAALGLTGAASAEGDPSLHLAFEVSARTGTVSAALFDSAEAFDKGGRPVRALRIDLSAGEAPEARFDGLAPGKYAARVMHDVNGNGKLDTNPFGMPTEPYGFTNNAKGSFGPAKWDAAAVEVTGPVFQTIVLK
jgi:uncharacterized protein (DUF2141 family)